MFVYSSNPKTGSTSFKKWLHRVQGETIPFDEMAGVHGMKQYGQLSEVYDWVEQELGRDALVKSRVLQINFSMLYC